MGRLTINLSESRQRALKAAAARWGKTMGELIEESLENFGIRTQEEAVELVRRARERSGLDEVEADALALEAAQAARYGRSRRRAV